MSREGELIFSRSPNRRRCVVVEKQQQKKKKEGRSPIPYQASCLASTCHAGGCRLLQASTQVFCIRWDGRERGRRDGLMREEGKEREKGKRRRPRRRRRRKGEKEDCPLLARSRGFSESTPHPELERRVPHCLDLLVRQRGSVRGGGVGVCSVVARFRARSSGGDCRAQGRESGGPARRKLSRSGLGAGEGGQKERRRGCGPRRGHFFGSGVGSRMRKDEEEKKRRVNFGLFEVFSSSQVFSPPPTLSSRFLSLSPSVPLSPPLSLSRVVLQ